MQCKIWSLATADAIPTWRATFEAEEAVSRAAWNRDFQFLLAVSAGRKALFLDTDAGKTMSETVVS